MNRTGSSFADIVKADEGLARAAALLAGGDLVAIPTETVYGLAADATDGRAVAGIYAAKGRPRFNPLIVHVSDQAMAEAIASFDPVSRRLAQAFWPGPLTLVLPLLLTSPIAPLATAGLDTVGIRMPQGTARELIARLGRPLAAPSANSSGRISPTTAQAVARDLGGKVALILDGGKSAVGVESTIVRVLDGHLHLLRPGGVPAEDIEQAAGLPLIRAGHGGELRAPGMLASHYAPQAAMRLDATSVNPDEALLAFGPSRVKGADNARAVLNLSPAGDLREAAANLFSHLAALDRAGAATIAVVPVPREGLGEAINDRLSRAAAPRDTPPTAQ